MPDSDSHDWLDSELRNVPLPNNLLARLQQSGPRLAPSDQRLDEELRAVEVPVDLESRLRRIARPRYRPTPEWQRMALAASVFVVLGLGVTGYVALIGGSFEGPARQLAHSPTETKPSISNPAETSPSGTKPVVSPGIAQETVTAQNTTAVEPVSIADHSVESRGLPLAARSAGTAATEKASPADARASSSAVPPALPSFDQVSNVSSTVKDALAARQRTQAALGASGALDRMPDLERVDMLVSRRGIAAPRVSGYDLLFQLKHGEHPFVSPTAHADLVSTRMPFTASTLGYDLARRAVAAGQSPSADDIRIEDFLSAQNYLLPPAPTSGLALHMAGTPSPLGKNGLYLMQVMVQSATRFTRPHAPTRMVVAVEMSWQMRSGGRWEATRRALAHLAEHMGEADRVTLVGFAEQARVLAADATGRQLGELLASDKLEIGGLELSGTTDFVEGIEAAVEAARTSRRLNRSQVMFLVANRKQFGQALAASKPALSELDGLETPWHGLCISPAGDDAPRLEGDKLREKTPAGTTLTVATSDALEDELAEALTDRPSTVASDVTLRLTFNAKVVTGYRLLGHEAMTLTGGATDPVVVDLRADHAASGMYELWIKPGNDEVVATAELDWRDPAGRQARRVARPLRRSQIEASFSQSPPWFQQGVVAAKAAEALCGSFYADSSKPLARVLEMAGEVDPRVAREPVFQDLLTTVRQAEKLR